MVHANQPVTDGAGTTKVGFVVSKAVGGAVVRNRVKRRLRHLSVPLLAETPQGTQVVVRALPPAATSTELGKELSGAWHGCLRKLAAYRPKQPAPEAAPS